jgi:hypothetical protein
MAVRFDEEIGEVRRDCGMHGGRGRYETNPVLLLVGDGFEAGRVVQEESSITDIAPSIIRHLALPETEVDGKALQQE